MTFTLTRSPAGVTSTCRTCGAAATSRSDVTIRSWQRGHTRAVCAQRPRIGPVLAVSGPNGPRESPCPP